MSYLKSVSRRLLKEAEGDEKPEAEAKPEGEEKAAEEKPAQTPSTNPDVSIDSQIDAFFVKLEGDRGLQEHADERWITRQFLEAVGDPTSSEFDPYKFAMGVMRLVNNYDTLLNIQDTIVKRAEKYIKDNKDESAAKEFMDELEESFGYKPDSSRAMKDYEYEAPPAVRSGGAS